MRKFRKQQCADFYINSNCALHCLAKFERVVSAFFILNKTFVYENLLKIRLITLSSTLF